MNAVTEFSGKQLDLIRRTVAKDCNPPEFEQFIHICKAVRLDPLRRQIYAFVFNKDNAAKRQMVIVTSIGGYRAIAARSGNYRPNGELPVFEYSEDAKDAASNPKGLIKATEKVWQYLHGEWHAIVAEARWDAYAPILKEGEDGFEWVDTGEKYSPGHAKAGKPKMRKQQLGEQKAKLDPNKGRWRTDPEGMLAKCAEALALRKAWPDDFAGTHVEDEIDRAHTLDLTATEIADEAASEAKLALMGGKDALTVLWDQGAKLERVPAGRFCDAVLEWTRVKDRTRTELLIWWKTNEAARAEYKARHGAEYLEFQRAFERRGLELESADLITEAAE